MGYHYLESAVHVLIQKLILLLNALVHLGQMEILWMWDVYYMIILMSMISVAVYLVSKGFFFLSFFFNFATCSFTVLMIKNTMIWQPFSSIHRFDNIQASYSMLICIKVKVSSFPLFSKSLYICWFFGRMMQYAIYLVQKHFMSIVLKAFSPFWY